MRKVTHPSPIDLSFTALRILLAISVVLPLFISPALAPVAHAAGETIVTTTSLANDPNDGACSLREALQAAFSQWSNGTASQKYNVSSQ